jgi:hypothetical protein
LLIDCGDFLQVGPAVVKKCGASHKPTLSPCTTRQSGAMFVCWTGRPVRTRDAKAKHISNLLRQSVRQPTDAVGDARRGLGPKAKPPVSYWPTALLSDFKSAGPASDPALPSARNCRARRQRPVCARRSRAIDRKWCATRIILADHRSRSLEVSRFAVPWR